MSFRPFLFLTTYPLKWTGLERKIEFPFLKVSYDPLSKYLILKRISCMQWLFWVVYQIKIGSRTSF